MKFILYLIFCCALSIQGFSQGTWSQTTNFPDSGRSMAIATTIGDTGYMFLGYKGSSLSYATWMYDHSTNIWTQKAPFPGTWRVDPFIFALNGDIFIGCGSTLNGSSCYNDVWKYSTVTDTWTLSTVYPGNNRNNFSYYTYNGKGYVIFGRNLCTIAESNNFYEFDPVSETWTAMTFPMNGYWRSRCAVYDNKVFLRNDGTSSVQVYDLATGLFDNSYPSVPSYFGSSTVENLIVAGGRLFEFNLGLLKYFHPPSRTWLNSDTAYHSNFHENPAIMVFGDTIKFICGRIPNTNNFTNDIWNFYFGCTSLVDAEVTSFDTTYFGARTELINSSVVNPSRFAYAYHWNMDTLITGWFTSDTSFVPNRFGNYTVELIADNGVCSDTFTKNIYVKPGMWSPKTALPMEVSARSAAIVFPIGNYAYMGFGFDFSSNPLNDFYRYDPASHRITTLNVFPDSTMRFISAITHNGKGYMLGGSNGSFPYKSNKFYEYNPTTDSWVRFPDFPGLSRANASTFIINNELYLCLGGVAETYKYNFSSASWTQLASHPQLTYGNHAFTYNGKGLIMLNGNSITQLWQYDPTSDAWSIYATNFLPENLSGVSATLIGNKLWIGYGKLIGNAVTDYRNSTMFYDLLSGQVTLGPSNYALANFLPGRTQATFFQLNGYTYSCFGKNYVGCDRLITRFESGACVNIPLYYPTDMDEAGLGIPIPVANSTSYLLPANPSSFQLVVDGIQTVTGITDPNSSVNFRICGEHKTQWVMNDVACTDTFTLYLTAHPVFNILSRADLPLGTTKIRHTMNSFSLNGKGYMGMGNKYVEIFSEAYKDWYEYDPGTNTWTPKSSLPAGASNTTGSSCFTDGTNGYITTGTDGCFVNASCYLNETWMYDPVIDSWTSKTAWPSVGRYISRAETLGDTAFSGMGYYTFSGSGNIYKYSFSGDTWTNANWPYGVGYLPAMFTYNNEFYAGYSPIGGSSNDWGLYKYNMSNGRWSEQLLKLGNLEGAYINKVHGNDVYLFDYAYVNKVDLIKKKVIPIQEIYIPGDTSNEFSAGFSIGDQVYFSMLNLDFGSTRLGNHFYLYDLAAPVCNLDSLILTAPLSEIKNDLILKISPNPATEKLTLQISDSKSEAKIVQIADVTGRIVFNSQINSHEIKIDATSFNNGVYIVCIKNSFGISLATEKFLITR